MTSNDKSKFIDAVLYYYELQPSDASMKPERELLESKSIDELKSLANTLLGECINRDMIKYVMSGTKGTSEQRMRSKLT
jgi:hypothetical protein